MTGDRARLLLAEDNPADVYLFRKALGSTGLEFDLTVFADDVQAMAYIRGEGEYAGSPVPDLAIIDLNLPKHDGIELLEAIRKSDRFANVPVVLTSSSAKAPAWLNEEHLGFATFIAKPPDLNEFMEIGVTLRKMVHRSGH